MRKIHKILVAAASGLLVIMGFGDCRCHKLLPLEYGTPYFNPDSVDKEPSENNGNNDNSIGDNKDNSDKVRKDLERVVAHYGVRHPSVEKFRDKE